MTEPLVVVDADPLGRERTGDETYIEGLLGAGAAVVGLFIMKVAFIDPLRGKVGFLPLVDTPQVVSTVIPLLIVGVLVSVLAQLTNSAAQPAAILLRKKRVGFIDSDLPLVQNASNLCNALLRL